MVGVGDADDCARAGYDIAATTDSHQSIGPNLGACGAASLINWKILSFSFGGMTPLRL